MGGGYEQAGPQVNPNINPDCHLVNRHRGMMPAPCALCGRLSAKWPAISPSDTASAWCTWEGAERRGLGHTHDSGHRATCDLFIEVGNEVDVMHDVVDQTIWTGVGDDR